MKSRLGRLAALVIVLGTLMALPGLAFAGTQPVATVTAAVVNVRQGPGTNYAVIDVAHAGDALTITGRNAAAGWYQVSLTSGKTGWISGSLVAVSGDAASIPEVSAPAAAATNVPAASTAATTSGRPQGGTIVFQVSSGGTIYAVNADGTGLRRLTTGMDPAISPDGTQVAFTRWDAQQAGATGSLWLINIDGSNEHQLMWGTNNPKSPMWSPDGKQLVLNIQQGGNLKDVLLCEINGKWVEVTVPIRDVRCDRRRANPWWGLRIVDATTGKYEDMPEDTHSFAPTWDPANAWHIFFRGDNGLESLDINLKKTWVVRDNSGAERAPVFSPDGKKIATSYLQTDHWEVHVMNADATGEVRLTETPQTVLINMSLQGQDPKSWDNAAPAWSPDGSQIAFVSNRNGAWEIWIMNADGSNQHPLLAADVMASLNLQYQGQDERVISWR